MKKITLNNFYDAFHKKSKTIKKIIDSKDFTYSYIIDSLNYPLLKIGNYCDVLDLGCGVGTISFYLSNKCSTVLGLDISKKAISIAKKSLSILKIKNINFICGKIDSLPKKQFDLVICLEVIEHIPDDGLFLVEINSRLKKNGYLVLSTPIKEIFLYKLNFYADFDERVGHLRRYSVSGLSKLMKSYGFNVLRVKKNESLMRSLFFTTRMKCFVKFIKFAKIFHFFDELFGRIFGFSNVIIIAQKK